MTPLTDTPTTEPRFATARDLVYVLFKYRLRILAVFLSTVATAYAVISVVPEKYDATATLLVQVGRENAGVPLAVLKETFVQGGVRQEHVNSEIAAIRSPALIAETVDIIGLQRFLAEPPPPQGLIEWLKRGVRAVYRGVRTAYDELLYALNLQTRLGEREGVIAVVSGGLDVSPVQASQVIDVTLRLPDPGLGADFVNALIARHLVRRTAYYREAGAARLFQEALGDRARELESAERALAEFRASSGISAIVQQRDLALTQLRAIDEKMQETEAATTRTRAELATLHERLKVLPVGVSAEQTTRNPVGQSLAERLATLYQKRSRMVGRFRADSRFMQEVDQEIALVEQQMRTQRQGDYGSTTIGINPTRQSIERLIVRTEARLVGLEAELEKQDEQRGRVRTRLDGYDRLEGRTRELERTRSMAEESLLIYRKKVEEAAIADEMSDRHLTNLVVLSAATPQAQPARPRKLLIMAIALAGGLLAGIGAAFAADAVDRSVRYGGDLARLGIPVLVTVPEVDGGLRPSLWTYRHAAG